MTDETSPGASTPAAPIPQSPAAPEQARSIERKANVLAAALRLLTRGGSAEVTHRRVAEESSSSPGAVRYYFRTREDLLAACLDEREIDRHRHAEELLQELAPGVSRHAVPTPDVPTPEAPALEVPTAEQVALWAIEIYYGSVLDDATVIGASWSIVDCARESTRLAALLETRRHAAEKHLAELLAHCELPRVTPSMLTAVIDGSVLSTALKGRTGAVKSAITEVVGILNLAR